MPCLTSPRVLVLCRAATGSEADIQAVHAAVDVDEAVGVAVGVSVVASKADAVGHHCGSVALAMCGWSVKSRKYSAEARVSVP